MERSLFALMSAVISTGTPRRFARLTLAEDPFFRRVPPGDEGRIVDFALRAGEAAAEMIVPTHGRILEAIAAGLRVAVQYSPEESQAGPFVHFSEYCEKPPTVTLFTESLENLRRLIQTHELEKILGLADAAPVHLAHEIYHHLETGKMTPGTAGWRIETRRLGPIRFRTGLPSLAEIAADCFAGTLLQMKVPPRALQFITIYSRNSDYAWSLAEKLSRFPA